MSQNPRSFGGFDKLGLKPFAERMERFLMVEHDFVEGGLVVSLNAPFGTGKTTFLTMWKEDIEERRSKALELPKVVIVNAWENDYCGDPLLSLVNALVNAAESDNQSKAEANQLREAAKDVGWFLLGLGNNLASHFSGLDPLEAANLAKEKNEAREPKIPDFVALYEERTKALLKLKNTLKQVFGGATPKIFLFIDELDRCRPDYAISYLETIKHVFDVHGMAFVLAVDAYQLECSAKALFGDLKFPDYYRKFVHRSITLPEPDRNGLRNLASHYVQFYLEKEGVRLSMLKTDAYRVDNVVELVSALRMPVRQIQEMFRIIGHTLACEPEQRGNVHWCLGVGVILMSALKVADPKMYERIGRKEVSCVEVAKFLTKLLEKESEWWISIYITAADDNSGQGKTDFANLFKEVGLIEADSTFDVRARLGDFSRGWGYRGDRWKEIFETIEAANSFR